MSGTWKDLTDNVNFMAGNLTGQVRGIAKVVTAVANGDLKQKLTVEAKGEIAALADTINSMIDTLATFADQVTTVAREVGVEGKLGGQASVPGAAGTWKDLTDNVNQLAANLTTQVRAIAEVATAVTKGDLTRSIKVEARGEVAALKDNINEMIRNLKDTTQKNSEQDWLKTNLAKFTRMLQGQKDLLTVGRLILSELAPVVSAQHGVFYMIDTSGEEPELQLLASYAYRERKAVGNRFELGEGLVGQCALEKEKILLTNVPADYIQITSGLGEAPPSTSSSCRSSSRSRSRRVIELASFDRFSATHLAFLDQLTESIGIVLNTIEANMRTEDLLKQSQSLARELQSQQEELRQTNQKLEEKAGLLAEQNAEVERKNQEVEQARQALEEKAEQLALTSKYKSEFLANMSHELRTPLNSLLILSDQLAENAEGNLTAKQIEYAKTIHASGTDLLMLINDILDLSKIESGTVSRRGRRAALQPTCATTSSAPSATSPRPRSCASRSSMDPTLPPAVHTDAKRLQQVLKNLLSNAFKFTEQGAVTLQRRPGRRAAGAPTTRRSTAPESVLAFAVSDTGIGIPPDKQQIIFEAFQQADGSTSRKYGGTGLGLAISREIARLLGGEIRVASASGEGSTFTLYLPQTYVAPKPARKPAEPRVRHRARSRRWPSRRPTRRRMPRCSTNELGDDRDDLHGGDRVLLIVENDENFARFLLDLAHEHGFKGVVTAIRRRRRGAGARLPAERHHARHPPARHRRLEGAQPPEERSQRPPHPGAHHLDRRGVRARPAPRRAQRPRQADQEQGDPRRRLRRDRPRSRARARAAAAGRRGRRRAAAPRGRAADRSTASSSSSPDDAARGAGGRREQPPRRLIVVDGSDVGGGAGGGRAARGGSAARCRSCSTHRRRRSKRDESRAAAPADRGARASTCSRPSACSTRRC